MTDGFIFNVLCKQYQVDGLLKDHSWKFSRKKEVKTTVSFKCAKCKLRGDFIIDMFHSIKEPTIIVADESSWSSNNRMKRGKNIDRIYYSFDELGEEHSCMSRMMQDACI